MKFALLKIFVLSVFTHLGTITLAQYATPNHTKGTCYSSGSNQTQGKAKIQEIHIYEFNTNNTVFFDNTVYSDCPAQNATNGHYRLNSNDTDFYLSATRTYVFRLIGSNPDGISADLSCGVWIDYDGDSAFSTSELISPTNWEITPGDEEEFTFIVPDSINTKNSRIRIRTDTKTNSISSANHSNSMEYGQTLDITYRQFHRDQLESNFWILDTAFVGSIVPFINVNPHDSMSYTWTINGVTYSTVDVIHVFPTSGSYIAKLVSYDFTNSQIDTITKSIEVIQANKKPIPRFAINPKAVELYDISTLYSLSQNFESFNVVCIMNGTDTFCTTDTSIYLGGSSPLGHMQRSLYSGNYVGALGPGAWSVCMKSYNLFDSSEWYCRDRVIYVGLDSTAPVISILGQADTTIDVFTSYEDLGALATDDSMGVITQDMTTSVYVDTAVVGDYTITYSVTDDAGNSISAQRIVKVRDRTKPVVLLVEDSTSYCIEHNSTTYLDAGATATDNYNGNLDSNVMMITNLDLTTLGSYYVKYWATDSSGNTSDTVTRVVNVGYDCTPPVITLNGPADTTVQIQFNVLATFTDPGATAVDNKDGDITHLIFVNGSIDSLVIDSIYTITYIVQDYQGNSASVDRIVRVDDVSIDLEIFSIDSSQINVYSSFDPKSLFQAIDSIDGNISDSLTFTSTVDTSKLGNYTVTASVTNSRGGTLSKTVVVSVLDLESPMVSFRGTQDTILVKVNSSFAPLDYLQIEDNYDDSTTIYSNAYDTVNQFDVTTLGLYSIVYVTEDSSGNVSNSFAIFVRVSQNASVSDILNNQGLTVFPNPVTNIVNIELGKANRDADIRLIDALGRYYTPAYRWTSRGCSLDLSTLSNGVYTLEVAIGAEVLREKIVIKR
jgi:hypothetical protein